MDQPSCTLNPRLEALVAHSSAMGLCVRRALSLASSEGHPLVLGESGAGCGTVAQGIHRASARAGMPLVEVFPPAIPAPLLEGALLGPGGALERARGGTLLLRYEFPELEGVLLRLFEQAAPDRSLERGQQGTRLIQTLLGDQGLPSWLEPYFADRRVNVPPLRERPEDVVPLAEQFLATFSDLEAPSRRFSAEALEAIKRRRWSGNVRELQGYVERAAVLSPGAVIGPEFLERRMAR